MLTQFAGAQQSHRSNAQGVAGLLHTTLPAVHQAHSTCSASLTPNQPYLTRMKIVHRLLAIAILLFLVTSFSESLTAQTRSTPIDTQVVSQHSLTVKGKPISYTAEVGTQPVWDDMGKPIATLHYTYYTTLGKKTAGGDEVSKRPLIISFNGGPGSGSVWMHLAYTGPKLLSVDDEGYPVQPYTLRDNPHSILDVADVVYVNPVNTGYSRMVPDAEGKMPDREQFFGINADVAYLAEWLNTFVTRKGRWLSPKYLIGESYGGTRVMGLAGTLQGNQWMYLNGVIMVSPADYKWFESDPPISIALQLPYMAATAHYHNMQTPRLQRMDLEAMLPLAERFALDTLMPAVARGGGLSTSEKRAIAERMSDYSGLSTEAILSMNLQVPTSFFWKELLRGTDEGYTVGRLDSRYRGIDRAAAGTRPDYNAELSHWLHAFTPGINHYFTEELGFKTDMKYNMFGPVRPWDNDDNNVREDLRRAMAANPYLNVLVQSGYYDGATSYFNAKYTTWQLDPSGRFSDRIDFEGYESGHMMYLRAEDLAKANEDIREFIRKSTPTGPARY